MGKIFEEKMQKFFILFPQLVLIKQSLFGFPWMVVSGALPYLSFPAPPFKWYPWVCMVAAFFCARFSGMIFNRVIDQHIDIKNPRTQKRAIAQGEVSALSAWLGAFFFLLLFFFFMSKINSTCFILSFVIALLLVGYSYTKRYTFLCHFFLGSIHMFIPICAWIAIQGSFCMAPLFLGLAAGYSIAANDIIYAMQDMEFDEENGFYSIPAAFGKTAALYIAKGVHFFSYLFLSLTAWYLDSFLMYIAALCIGALYISSYIMLSKNEGHPFIFEKTFVLSNTLSGIILLFCISLELFTAR